MNTRATAATVAFILVTLAAAASAGPLYEVVVLHNSFDAHFEALSGTQQGGYIYVDGQPHAAIWNSFADSYIDLHPADCPWSSEVTGMNDTHQFGAVGSKAAMWSGTAESYISLHPTGFTYSYISGCYGNQQVGYVDDDITAGAAIWNGTAESYVSLNPEHWGQVGSFAHATDGMHQVGTYYDKADLIRHAVVWSGTAESAIRLDAGLSGESYAYGVSGNQIVGHNGGDPAITDRDTVSALLWTWNGTDWTLNSLMPSDPQISQSWAFDTNGIQQIGYCEINGGLCHAYVWSGSANSALDLNQFLPDNYSSEAYAIAISANGDIVGQARNMTTGQFDTILWQAQPAPEPATLGLFSLGGLAIIRRRRSR